MLAKLLLTGICFAIGGIAHSDSRIQYLLHCGGCHLPDGVGIPPEVPTLVNELGRVIDLDGGREYLVRVPGVAQAPMPDTELAGVLNWVLLEFNKRTLPKGFKPFTANEVAEGRNQILTDPLKHRTTLW